jgi:hypothetical protein
VFSAVAQNKASQKKRYHLSTSLLTTPGREPNASVFAEEVRGLSGCALGPMLPVETREMEQLFRWRGA